MKRYRNKATGGVVEAFQWWGEAVDGFRTLTVGRGTMGGPRGQLVIPGTGGAIRADEGDWILRFATGEYHRLVMTKFEATYEPVRE